MNGPRQLAPRRVAPRQVAPRSLAWTDEGARWLEEHGGELPAAARRSGRAPGEFLDFSVSLNPFGPPPGVLRAAARSLRRGGPLTATAYPPRDGSPLKEALAARLGVPPECCLLANGGAEAIHLLVRAAAPRRVVVLVPCFGEYARAAAALGIPVVAVSLASQRGFAVGRPELESLARLLRPGDLLFLANPNNPTGRLVPPGVLACLVELAGERRALLGVDEAFLPLAAEDGASLAWRAALGDPVAVVGSLTKVYALPGLRLGYVVAAPALVAAARRQQPPWAVNSMAIAAGLACLEADAGGSFARRSRELLAQEREWLRRRLARTRDRFPWNRRRRSRGRWNGRCGPASPGLSIGGQLPPAPVAPSRCRPGRGQRKPRPSSRRPRDPGPRLLLLPGVGALLHQGRRAPPPGQPPPGGRPPGASLRHPCGLEPVSAVTASLPAAGLPAVSAPAASRHGTSVLTYISP